MTPITLRCPACAHTWLAAIINGAVDETTPAAIAKRCYCVRCEASPPMTLVPDTPD
jgi:hypothetical protein